MLTTATVLVLGWPAASAQAAAYLSHRTTVDIFRDAGISTWSSGNCSNRNNANCTSFERVRRSTVDGLLTLRKASKCDLRVTGGTETGHGSGTYTHWNGWKLDISKYDCIGRYIKRYFRYVGYIKGWGYQYKAPSGNIYTDEGNHWDILYYSCGGCSGDDDDQALSPSPSPSPSPSAEPSPSPSATPSASASPSAADPSVSTTPSAGPPDLVKPSPSMSPSAAGNPSPSTSAEPSAEPTAGPSGEPSAEPTAGPSGEPSAEPTAGPSGEPSVMLPPPPVGEPVPPPTKLLRSVDPEPVTPPATMDPARVGAPIG
ncbi:PT domain-containing protein [Catellatospora methionotrophica]|uniref:PT domain-containing protein n=1 Tax=Catellatospora methionotrophica TaxID=121620 RepID=UPI0033D42574